MVGFGPREVAGGQPLWRRTAMRAERWRDLGATDYEMRAIRYGILDLPTSPLSTGVVLPAIPQTEEDLEFGRADLTAGCASGIYEQVSREQVRDVLKAKKLVSSAFTV
jgi:hypothetical protein